LWNISLTGGDAESVSAELSSTTPQKFIQWCEHMSIVRCDVDRASDIACFAGRTPLSLGVIHAWQNQSAVRESLSNLMPGELATALNDLAGNVLNAGNTRMDDLHERAGKGDYAAQIDLELTTNMAELELKRAGFDLPPERNYDPPVKPELTEAQWREKERGWGLDLEYSDDMGQDSFGKPLGTTPWND
jgi:hypothetical protein